MFYAGLMGIPNEGRRVDEMFRASVGVDLCVVFDVGGDGVGRCL